MGGIKYLVNTGEYRTLYREKLSKTAKGMINMQKPTALYLSTASNVLNEMKNDLFTILREI